jgi:hypothetical protein
VKRETGVRVIEGCGLQLPPAFSSRRQDITGGYITTTPCHQTTVHVEHDKKKFPELASHSCIVSAVARSLANFKVSTLSLASWCLLRTRYPASPREVHQSSLLTMPTKHHLKPYQLASVRCAAEIQLVSADGICIGIVSSSASSALSPTRTAFKGTSLLFGLLRSLERSVKQAISANFPTGNSVILARRLIPGTTQRLQERGVKPRATYYLRSIHTILRNGLLNGYGLE